MPTAGQIFIGIAAVSLFVLGLYWLSRFLEWFHERRIGEDRRSAQQRWDAYAEQNAQRAEQIRQRESNVVPIFRPRAEPDPFSSLPAGVLEQTRDAQSTTSSD